MQGKPSDAAGCGSSSYVSWNGLVLAVDSGCGSGGLQLRDTAGVVASTGNELPVLTDGSWHQIGYTYDPAAHTVVLYLDGVAITTVTGAVLHEATTPFLTTFNGGIDEAAIYPAVLPADRIAAHYGRALAGTGTLLGGTVTYQGAPVPQSAVQACSSPTTCATATTNDKGHYQMRLTAGNYAVTAFPPPSGPASGNAQASGSISIGDNDATATVDLAIPVPELPPGATLTSPSGGTQTGIPRVNWAEPSVYRMTGCPGGVGLLYMVAPDTATGQLVRRVIPMLESQPARVTTKRRSRRWLRCTGPPRSPPTSAAFPGGRSFPPAAMKAAVRRSWSPSPGRSASPASPSAARPPVTSASARDASTSSPPQPGPVTSR